MGIAPFAQDHEQASLLAHWILTLALFGAGCSELAPSAHKAELSSESASKQEPVLEGTLAALQECGKKQTRLLHYLETNGARLSLQFEGRAPDLSHGSRVRVSGRRVDDALIVGSSDGWLQVLDSAGASTLTSTPTDGATTPLPNTLGAQKTLVILVNFQDQPTLQPWTQAQIASAVFGTVSSYLQENAYRQATLTGDVRGWYTIPVSSTAVCDTSQIASGANSMTSAAGVDLSAYSRIIYFFPYNANCAWSGQATIGGNPSQSWINGGTSYLQDDGTVNYNGAPDTGIIAHELGHNFGLYHSHALECAAAVVGSSCTTIEYGDTLDTMGGGEGHFSAPQKQRLGWLDYGSSPPITTVSASGVYSIDPYETFDNAPKALKILKPADPATGVSTWYYVEYRQPIGFDVSSYPMLNNSTSNGVVVHIATGSSPNSSDLLDMTPDSSACCDWYDVALAVGQSFSDPNSGITITTTWASSTNAGIDVKLSQPICLHASPSISVFPASQSGSAGEAKTYSVTLSNQDGSSCSSSSFTLSYTLPIRWSGAFSAQSLSLAPGANASSLLTIAPPLDASAGAYSIAVSATNAMAMAYAATTTTSYAVVAGPTVMVSTNQAAYRAGQTVKISAYVTLSGAALSGASVSFTIFEPNGAIVSGISTTSSTGTAAYAMKLGRKSPSGNYAVKAMATSGGSSGSNTTTFTVR